MLNVPAGKMCEETLLTNSVKCTMPLVVPKYCEHKKQRTN